MKNGKYRIIWAVDPFAKPARFQRSAVRAITEISRDVNTEVFPIHVMAAGLAERLREAPADSLVKIRHRGQANMEGIIGKKDLAFKPLHILSEKFSSLKGGVNELVRFATKIKADLIVLSTHARQGPRRWVLGSFAETFSTLSDVPILITPPNWNPQGIRKSVLFATDFSKESLAAYERLLAMASEAKWGVTVFHHVDYPIYPAYEFAFASWTTYEEDLREVAELRRKEAEKMVEKGKSAGVAVDIVIHTPQTMSAADSAIRQLKKGYLFVALASQSGLLRNAILGSTTRQLIRKSPVPVWVMHPPKEIVSRKLMMKPPARSEAPRREAPTFVV